MLATLLPSLPMLAAAVVWLAAVELAKPVRWWALFGAARPRFGACLRLTSRADVVQAARDPRVVTAVAGATFLVWACGIAANWAVLAAVGIQPTLDLAARVIVLGYLIGLLPAPPARIGVYEAGVAA